MATVTWDYNGTDTLVVSLTGGVAGDWYRVSAEQGSDVVVQADGSGEFVATISDIVDPGGADDNPTARNHLFFARVFHATDSSASTVIEYEGTNVFAYGDASTEGAHFPMVWTYDGDKTIHIDFTAAAGLEYKLSWDERVGGPGSSVDGSSSTITGTGAAAALEVSMPSTPASVQGGIVELQLTDPDSIHPHEEWTVAVRMFTGGTSTMALGNPADPLGPPAPPPFTAPTIRKVATIVGTGGSATGGGFWDVPFNFDDGVAADEYIMMVVGGAMIDGTVSPTIQPQPAVASLLQANIDDDAAAHACELWWASTVTRGPTPVEYPFPNPGTQITRHWPLTAAIHAGDSGTVRIENQFANTRDIDDFVAIVLAVQTTPTIFPRSSNPGDDAAGGEPGNTSVDQSNLSDIETVTAFDLGDDSHYPTTNFDRDADYGSLLLAAFTAFTLDTPTYVPDTGVSWAEYATANDGSGIRVGVVATQLQAGNIYDYTITAEWASAVGSSGALVQIRVNALASGGVGLRAWQRF